MTHPKHFWITAGVIMPYLYGVFYAQTKVLYPTYSVGNYPSYTLLNW